MTEAPSDRIERLAVAVRGGSRIALGRALTLVESGGAEGAALLKALVPHAGKARIVGVTGPPGAGKSTLVDALICAWRTEGRPVAVLAVDPVSPVSGGAVLGDRTRMGAHSLDDGVFIRSVSARGHLGGLSAAAHDMADVMDAAGWPLILIETVGAGQSETEIACVADLSLVVSAPGLGDDVQAIKSGILEIADVLVVNKADGPEAAETAKHLETMLALRPEGFRDVPVLNVSATMRTGIDALKDAIDTRLPTAGGDRAARRRAHKDAVASQRLAARLSASMPEGGIADLATADLDRVLRDALVALSDENKPG